MEFVWEPLGIAQVVKGVLVKSQHKKTTDY